jgi:hypothetical protein
VTGPRSGLPYLSGVHLEELGFNRATILEHPLIGAANVLSEPDEVTDHCKSDGG